MHYAAKLGFLGAAHALLVAGADPLLRTNEWEHHLTPYEYALYAPDGYQNPQIVELLRSVTPVL